MIKEKKRFNFYLEVELIEKVKAKREENKTFTTTAALVNALLQKYANGEIIFK